MPKALHPSNEADRLLALRASDVLDTPREAGFDDLTSLASSLCDVPIAAVSLVDESRQWFKSCVGLGVRETSRDAAICAHTILQHEPLIIPDTTKDPRTSDSPLVTGAPYLRFYAGVPLITRDGFALGALCVADTRPRELNQQHVELLKKLASQATAQLELRRANR